MRWTIPNPLLSPLLCFSHAHIEAIELVYPDIKALNIVRILPVPGQEYGTANTRMMAELLGAAAAGRKHGWATHAEGGVRRTLVGDGCRIHVHEEKGLKCWR